MVSSKYELEMLAEKRFWRTQNGGTCQIQITTTAIKTSGTPLLINCKYYFLIKYWVCIKPGRGWKEMGAPVLRPLLTGLLAGLIFSSWFLAGLLRLIRSDQLAWSGVIWLPSGLARSDHRAGSGQLASSGRLGWSGCLADEPYQLGRFGEQESGFGSWLSSSRRFVLLFKRSEL